MKNNIVQLNNRTNLLKNRAQLSTDSGRFQPMIASGALASVLFVVTVLNLTMSHNETQAPSRAIASVQKQTSVQADKWSATLMKRLVSSADRKMASAGDRATEIDQFRFGVLEGKYLVRFENKRIKGFEFIESDSLAERPKYIGDKSKFLLEHRHSFAVEFESAQSIRRVVENGQIIEEFALLGPSSSSTARIPSSNSAAKVKFRSDEFDRVLSMNIEK